MQIYGTAVKKQCNLRNKRRQLMVSVCIFDVINAPCYYEFPMTTTALIHPGEHLAEILDELGISQYRLAKAIGVAPIRINEIVHCRRSITADTALRIGQALGTTPEFWLNLQRMYDLDRARASTDISTIEPLVESSTALANF